MNYYGTRNPDQKFTLQQAAVMGLAPCGGLFMPQTIPSVDMNRVREEADRSFAHMAFYIADLIFGEDMDRNRLHDLVFDAFNFEVPLHRFGNSERFTLELFHGPTLAFKDFGARFIGRMLCELHNGTDEVSILTATSGDTGSAVADGFFDLEGIKVYILYPDGKVSDFQERQMTTLGKNIIPLKVRGTFDDCQRMVKEIFADTEFCASHQVTSANSISILRWLPQSLYYFYGYHLWTRATGLDRPTVVVPSGNFGNITAGILAKKMGLPIEHFVAATNANDVIPQYLVDGTFTPRPSVQTLANAMDVGNPSNYERLVELYGSSIDQIRQDLTGLHYTDNEINAAISEIYTRYDYLSCPHSAIGYLALNEIDRPGFYLSTAHASKFESVIESAVGQTPAYPERMMHLFEKEKSFTTIDADSALLKSRLFN